MKRPTKIDVHQHLWSEPLVHALARRDELPFVRHERGVTVLHLAGERPYVIEMAAESPSRRAQLVEHDGLDRALLCLSSPLGIEWLPRAQALALIDAYHRGALEDKRHFGAWGAVPLQRPEPDDVDNALARGCMGISLPAGALAGRDALERVRSLLRRVEQHDVPLLVHAGPGGARSVGGAPSHELLSKEPLWWPALTSYVAGMQAAWLAFVTLGRAEHPRLRVVFTMLAGLAPLQLERLRSRGGSIPDLRDPLLFYDTASYGPTAVAAVSRLVSPRQILYGSDRPVVDPSHGGLLDKLDWTAIADGTRRAIAEASVA